MTSYLRPTVSLAAWSKVNHGYYGPASFVRFRNREFFMDSNTPYMRIWVSWPYLQPKPTSGDPHNNFTDKLPSTAGGDIPSNGPENYEQAERHQWVNMSPGLYLQQLDDTIIQARRAGLKIILAFHQTPYWANSQRRQRGAGSRNSDLPYLCPPDWVAPGSPWAYITEYLLIRYSMLGNDPRFGGYGNGWRWVDFFEVCNEPNTEWWPQFDTLSDLAAEMMKVGRGITARIGHQPIILGPALSDSEGLTADPGQSPTDPRRRIDYRAPAFTDRMLAWFRANGFAEDRSVGWSHHNYRDIEIPRTHENSWTHQVRDKLRNYQSLSTIAGVGWRGWGGDASNPGQILLTEGGARLNKAEVNGDPNVQAAKVGAAWDRLLDSGENREGQDVGNICNYLFWSDADFDTGMCHALEYWHENNYGGPPITDGFLGRDFALPDAARPLFSTWRSKFTNAPRDTSIGYRQWYSIGAPPGGAQSGPDCCSLRTGHIEVFMVGGDRTDVFVRSNDNNIWWGYMQPNGQWIVYYPLGSPPGGATSAPDVLSQTAGQLEVFVRGGNGELYHNWMYNYGGWSGWHPMGGGQVVNDPAAISWGNGRMDVFALDPGGSHLKWWWWQSDSGWHGPNLLKGPQILEHSPEFRDAQKTRPIVVGGVDAASQEPGQMEVFVRGCDQFRAGDYYDQNGVLQNPETADDMVFNVWRMEYVPSNGATNGPWTGWEWLNAPRVPGKVYSQATSDPTGVSWYKNHTQLFVRGEDSACWTTHQALHP